MAAPRRTGVRFRPRELPATDASAFVRDGMRGAPTGYEIEAVVHAPAERVRAQVGRWAEIEADGGTDGEARCRLRMRTDSLDWPAMALGSLRAEFAVLGPPEMVEHLRDWGARFGRAVDAAGR
jgi:predicted DNA-binding transcriptional regulator YafY